MLVNFGFDRRFPQEGNLRSERRFPCAVRCRLRCRWALDSAVGLLKKMFWVRAPASDVYVYVPVYVYVYVHVYVYVYVHVYVYVYVYVHVYVYVYLYVYVYVYAYAEKSKKLSRRRPQSPCSVPYSRR
jgi:hypothetical protein